jgi:cytochrome P450
MAPNSAGVATGTPASAPPVVEREGSVNDMAFLLDCYRRYGPIFTLPQRGAAARRDGDLFTVLAGPEANLFTMRATAVHQDPEAITLRSDNHWEEFSNELGMQGHTREGDAHKRHRTLTKRGYARTAVLHRIPDLVRYAAAATRDWQSGTRLAVVADIQRMVSEQLGQVLIGYSPAEYVPELVTFVRTTKITMLLQTHDYSALATPEYAHARDRVFELGQRAIAARLGIPPAQRPGDLLDDMLAARGVSSADDAPPLLLAATIGPFLAGLETASYRTAFLLDLLLRHPKVLDRVRAEVARWFAGPLTWERLKECRALFGGMMDALRLYPGPARLWYRCVRDFTFAGHRVQAGESVIVVYDMPHRLAEVYPRPEQFDVDRYEPPRSEHRRPGVHAPFGIGGHTCLGSGIAEVQMMTNVAVMLHRHDLVPDPLGMPFDADADADLALHIGVLGRRR